jgi:hypothetical protein
MHDSREGGGVHTEGSVPPVGHIWGADPGGGMGGGRGKQHWGVGFEFE